MSRIPAGERMAVVRSADGTVPPGPPDWAAWVDRWKPTYLWHGVAVGVAVQCWLAGKKCKVVSEEREDVHGVYWVWRVELA